VTPVLASLHALVAEKSRRPALGGSTEHANRRVGTPFREGVALSCPATTMKSGHSYIHYRRPGQPDPKGLSVSTQAGHLAVYAFDEIGVPSEGQF